MSRRMAHFTHSQLVWECQKFIQGEDGATLNKDESDAVCSDDMSKANIPDWKTAVEEYSRLHLSFEKDRLPAISAIVQAEMRIRKNDVYMAGMWKDSLLEDILWYRPWNHLRKGDLRPERISPSWSWASVRGPVIFPRPLPGQGGQLEGVQITEITFSAKGQPHMGEYSEASIRLKAPFTEAVFDSSHSGSYPMMPDLIEQRDSSNQSSKNIASGTLADYYFLDAQYENLESQQYAFVFISFIGQECQGLILRQRSDTEYERIGTCSCYIPGKEPNGDASAEERGVQSYLSSLPLREVKII